MTKSEFERALLSGKLEQWKNVGHEFRGAPHCAIGSEIKLSITFCDPRGYAEMDKCEQVKSLLASAKEQLNANVECRFEPSFYADLNEVVVETGKSGSN